MAASISRCPACQGSLSVDASLVGGRVTCPHCGRSFRVAKQSKAAAAPDKPAARSSLAAPLPSAAPPDTVPVESDFDELDTVVSGPDLEHGDLENWDESSGYRLTAGQSEFDGPAPMPPPRKPRTQKAATKPGRKDASRADPRRSPPFSPKLIAAGVAGGVLILVLLIVGVVAAVRGLSGGPQSDVAANIEVPEGDYYVIDEPLPGITAAIHSPSAFSAAPAANPVTVTPRPGRDSSAPAASEDSAQTTTPRWSLPADPRPADQVYEYAEGVRLPIETIQLRPREAPSVHPPVFADRGGPVVLMVPHWTEHPYEIKSKSVTEVMGNMTRGRLVFTLQESPQSPAPVIDLRTGEAIGEFSWKSPFWNNPRLSPDGKYLVGRDAAPYWLRPPEDPDAIKTEPNTLFAWKHKQDRPAHKLPVSGAVMWLEFVNNDEIAVFVVNEKSTLLLWNVATGEVTTEVPLSVAPYEVNTSPIDGHWGYVANPLLGAVSPGGRYVAVGGHDGISLVSVAERREVGTFPVDPGERKFEWPYRGLSFPPDGDELFAIFHFPHQGMQLWTLSVTTGATLREHQLGTLSVYGQIAPGPEPGTLLASDPSQGTTLFDGTTNRWIANHAAIYRWSDSGPVVAVGALPGQAASEAEPPADGATPESPQTGVYTTAAVHSAFGEALSDTDFGMPRRPRPVQPDRSGVEITAPEPPASWTPPPLTERPAVPADVAYLTNARPAAFGGKELAVIQLPRRELTKRGSVGSSYYYYEVVWERHDRLTGQRAGDAITLWPWVRNPAKAYDQNERMMVALSDDDRLLALRDGDAYGRVDVWNSTGERIVGFYPADAETTIEWLGWDAGGRLLTLAGGVLAAWEVPAAKAVYEIDGRYTAPIDLLPGRDWIAISAGTHIDLLDTATGRCIGRCAVEVAGKVGDIAVSPDGARLAAVFLTTPGAAERLGTGQLNPTSDTMDGTLVLWDLRTGKAEMVSLRPYKYGLLHWGGPEHLAFIDGNATIYDLRAGIPVLYHNYGQSSWPNDGLPHQRSPDGRLWAAVESGYQTWDWMTTRVPDPEGQEDAPFVDPDRKYFVAGDDPVQIEIDCGSRSNSEKFGRDAARALQMRGFKIGPGGWRLVVSHKTTDSGNSLVFGNSGTPIPKVDYFWQLLDAKGTVVWQENGEGNFPLTQSKYHTKTRDAYDYAPGEQQLTTFETMEYYDFGSLDPREAMEDEILERGPDVGLLERLPKVLLEVQGQYPTFPVSRDMAVTKLEAEAPPPQERR